MDSDPGQWKVIRASSSTRQNRREFTVQLQETNCYQSDSGFTGPPADTGRRKRKLEGYITAFLCVLIYTQCVYDYNIFDHQPCELAFICFCINLATSTATSSEVLLTVSRQSWKGTISNLHMILKRVANLGFSIRLEP